MYQKNKFKYTKFSTCWGGIISLVLRVMLGILDILCQILKII